MRRRVRAVRDRLVHLVRVRGTDGRGLRRADGCVARMAGRRGGRLDRRLRVRVASPRPVSLRLGGGRRDLHRRVAPRAGGRRLYEELLGPVRERGLRVLCAGVALPNDASDGLHRALGFEEVGVYRRIGWKAGRWHDVRWWQLHLAGDGPPANLQV